MQTEVLRPGRRSAAPAVNQANTHGGSRFSLDRREVLSFGGDHRDRTVICHQGGIWLTQPGDPTDHHLTAGQEFAVTRKGRIVVQGLEESRLELL